MFLQVSVIHSVHRGGRAWQGGACVVLFGRGGMRGFIRGGACVVLFGGACMVLFGGVRGFIRGGRAWFYSGGACVVLFGGHAWFYSGGVRGFIRGGMHGFIRGACMVLFGGGMCGFIQQGGACMVLFSGGRAWFYSAGGVHGFIQRGGMRGFFSFSGYNEIRSMSGRYASYWNAFLFNNIFCRLVLFLIFNVFRKQLRHCISKQFITQFFNKLTFVTKAFKTTIGFRVCPQINCLGLSSNNYT